MMVMTEPQTAKQFIDVLQKYYNPERAKTAAWFFKTGKGGYSEGDQFLGATVPSTRIVCKEFKDLPLSEVDKLLASPIHDHRLGAVIILVNQYKKAKKDPARQDAIFELYVKRVHAGNVNNWDIVDTSAAYIIGPHEEAGDRKLLFKLAQSDNLWHKRIGIMSAFWYTQHGDFGTTIKLAELLLHDAHDLIHKAVGWQLREVGKRGGRDLLLNFLDKHASTMPRTALRYAIEHLPPEQRSHYMQL
jgi:3-methyladenine DNA glycosylase AlkD